jgi:O-antigen biosynthesis protein
VKTIDQCLASVFQQTLLPDEVVVVDGNSEDGTLEIIKKYPAKVVTEPGLGYGYARNIGLENATGDIIAFVDSDCQLEKNYLTELIPPLANAESNIAGVGGITYPIKKNLISESLNVRLFGISTDTENKIREIDTIGGGTSAYHKELLKKIGGFDTEVTGGEDYELNIRLRKAGYKLLLIPTAISYHLHPTTLKKLAKKWYNYGKFLVDMALKKGQTRLLLSTWGWIIGCIAVLAVAIYSGNLIVWLILLFAFFVPWVLYYGKQTATFIRHNPKAKYLALPFIHQTIILSRSSGVVVATFQHIFKIKPKKK